MQTLTERRAQKKQNSEGKSHPNIAEIRNDTFSEASACKKIIIIYGIKLICVRCDLSTVGGVTVANVQKNWVFFANFEPQERRSAALFYCDRNVQIASESMRNRGTKEISQCSIQKRKANRHLICRDG